LPLNSEIELKTILIRCNKCLKIPDAIIVASALALGATLLTNDQQMLKIKWPGLVIHSALDLNNRFKQ
jgi:predicted nucleic acid-binding protein